MTWTTQKPTKAGWYWWRDIGFEAQPVVVYDFNGLKVLYIGESADDELTDIGGEWAGPLPEPEEPS